VVDREQPYPGVNGAIARETGTERAEKNTVRNFALHATHEVCARTVASLGGMIGSER
jgi:hypothetical protein